jgi:hypothetical protein
MIIYDEKNKKRLTGITLFLTPEEMAELADTAADLSEDPHKQHHHVSSADYASEITLAVYTKENIGQFDAESQMLIRGTKTE